ncbi:MAG: hypothetical protein RI955_1097 [Bacteroidota bacterium]|jgi:uncharacterized protein (TIGR01777 family)
MKKIIVAGGSGFLGKSIVEFFDKTEYEFVILSRNNFAINNKNCKVKIWNGKSIGDWSNELEGAEAVINLSGKSINCRYTDANKIEILESRIDTTNAIGNAILNCKNPPKVWMNASSATLYEYTETENQTEDCKKYNDDFSTHVCMEWEKALNYFETKNTRKIALRISIVLGKDDGVFTRLKMLTKFGLGGKQGNGKQYVSWIHITDFCRCIEFFMNQQTANGAYNLCTPNPITNEILMQTFRQKMKINFGIPSPNLILKLGALIIGTEPELVLKSRRVVPKKIMDEGFKFLHPSIDTAIESLL